MLAGKRILLIVTGGIAAYKSLDLVRRLRERGASVRCVLTEGGAQFVTPLSLAALSEQKVFAELFSLTDEAEMGHIQLSRDADLLVVAPATADFLAKMANGLADDLASTLILATDTDVLVAPAMNHRMWLHPATRENMARLEARGVATVGPNVGDMACNETGPGRMAEPLEIVAAMERYFAADAPLAGRRALVTSGPTVEALDPVRFLTNRSSGKQGHAIADALARRGAETTLVAGPTALADPRGVTVRHVESAAEMLQACRDALPVDVAVCAAAVSDWRAAEAAAEKLKKPDDGTPPTLALEETPDILASLSAAGNARPALVVGFAAETEDLIANARAKLARKGCDWIVANDVSAASGTFGGDDNTVHLVRRDNGKDGAGGGGDGGDGDDGHDDAWPRMTKQEVADRLADRVAAHLAAQP